MNWKDILKIDEEIEKFGIKFAEGAQEHYNFTLNQMPSNKKSEFKNQVKSEWKNQKQPITSEAINRLKNVVMAIGSISGLPPRTDR